MFVPNKQFRKFIWNDSDSFKSTRSLEKKGTVAIVISLLTNND